MKTKRIQIKDLKPGMKIKTLSEDGTIVFKAVEKVWDTHVPSSRQRELIFNNGSKLVCSDTHPIMVRSGDYIIEKYPDDLTYQDTIVGSSGDIRLEKINSFSTDPNFIDIEVDETETFFASANETGPMVLTHNCSQGGVRGAAATVSYPWWHYEFEELISFLIWLTMTKMYMYFVLRMLLIFNLLFTLAIKKSLKKNIIKRSMILISGQRI